MPRAGEASWGDVGVNALGAMAEWVAALPDEAAACMVCLDCEGQAREYANLVKVSEKKQLFQFSVESTGALRPELIVLRGVEVLQRKLNDIRANMGSGAQLIEQ